MPALPRGWCPLCGKEVSLRKDGVTREHEPADSQYAGAGIVGRQCRGSGEPGLTQLELPVMEVH